ncbi:uncharacterized protein METZ01_LOCUS59396, partial [marine metagenome]
SCSQTSSKAVMPRRGLPPMSSEKYQSSMGI